VFIERGVKTAPNREAARHRRPHIRIIAAQNQPDFLKKPACVVDRGV
jgi:hypothetical protein